MEKYEAPKKYTAINEITGNLVKSRGTNQDKYNEGWEAVFGRKEQEVKDILDSPSIQIPPDLDREQMRSFIMKAAGCTACYGSGTTLLGDECPFLCGR